MRPVHDVLVTIRNLREDYPELDIQLAKVGSHEKYDTDSIIRLMTRCPFILGSEVQVTTSGDYQDKVLEYCTERIGKIFSLKTNERSWWEISYKSEYGCYPDEEQVNQGNPRKD